MPATSNSPSHNRSLLCNLDSRDKFNLARSLSQYHRAFGCPSNAHGLANSILRSLIGLAILLKHGQHLSSLNSHAPLSAFTKIDRRIDFSGQTRLPTFV